MSLSPLHYSQIKQKNFCQLQDFSPSDITILDDYLNDITQKDVNFLNTFNPDKLLFHFRKTAGLENKAASSYSGWEDTRIGGHTTGHYLAAAGQALARGYGDSLGSDGKSLQQRFEYLIDGLEECQKALGTGFIFGATMEDPAKPELQFDRLEMGQPAETWVPWYTVHKIMNGLVEAYKSTGSKKALEIGLAFADWIYKRTSRWTEEIQARVLATEYGGMNDCLYELYKCAKSSGCEEELSCHILEAAHHFDELPLFKKIKAAKAGDNALNNRHANTTIPKFVGAMNRYMTLKDEEYLEYAKAFWSLVVNNHSYITGGNSECEHFGADNILDQERSNTNCETCNTHNMLKLTRMLFMASGEKQYADYYENTFINAILASVNASNGMTLYFQPMATGCFKTYCNPDVDKNYFWCCTGTGLENFTKLGDSIYFHDDKSLIVNQFVTSKVSWQEKGLVLEQKTELPGTDFTEISLCECREGCDFTLAVRSPDWNYLPEEVFINNSQAKEGLDYKIDSGYLLLNRHWRADDKIRIKFNMNIQAFPLPDKNGRALAFKYGPVVLAAELGRDDKMTLRQVGVQCDVSGNKRVRSQLYELTGNYGGTSNLPLLPGEILTVKEGSLEAFLENINEHFVKKVNKGDRLSFELTGSDWDQGPLIFSPYYLINNQRYGIYWIFKDENSKTSNIASSFDTSKIFIEGIGIGYGAQTEGNEKTYPFMKEEGNGSVGDPHELSRYAKEGGSFSYIFKTKPGKKNFLVCTFLKEDDGKSLEIKAEGKAIAQIILNSSAAASQIAFDGKYTMDFALPDQEIEKGQIRISFSGIKNTASARLFSPVNTVYTQEE